MNEFFNLYLASNIDLQHYLISFYVHHSGSINGFNGQKAKDDFKRLQASGMDFFKAYKECTKSYPELIFQFLNDKTKYLRSLYL